LTRNPRVLVDFRTADDAGVYEWDAGPALVQTVDFFTPIVDDPFVFGQIAAANALSDVYAMGGEPRTALAIAAFPDILERDAVRAIFRGGYEKLREAGTALLGGHTVKDVEIKFGYAVTGSVDPKHVLTNAGAQVGDALVLTKPIGTGVIGTAIKFGQAPENVVTSAVESMVALNSTAATHLSRVARACTDVTGFGLIGHSTEIARASEVTLEIVAETVPVLAGALDLVGRHRSAGMSSNRQHFGEGVEMAAGVRPDLQDLLFDPQTSGGLLAAVPSERAQSVVGALLGARIQAVRIGTVTPKSAVNVRIR
jgi:selenide,water dikinase